MAKVHFAPWAAIKYVGAKQKEFTHSLARPKPMIKRGDILIVDKKTAFNLVQKGYEEFVSVDEIEFVKAGVETAMQIKELEDTNTALEASIVSLEAENGNLRNSVDALEGDNEAFKARIAELEALVPDADLAQGEEAHGGNAELEGLATSTDLAQGEEAQGGNAEGAE